LDLGKNSTESVETRGSTRRDRLVTMSIVVFGLLGVEFLLGMFLNLFVSIPTSDPFSTSGLLPLGLHMTNAFLLLLISIAMIFVARGLGDRKSVGITSLTTLTLFVAISAGFRFIFGGQDNVTSYIMSTGFLAAVLLQVYLIIHRSLLAIRVRRP
jgi:hypothetical protein